MAIGPHSSCARLNEFLIRNNSFFHSVFTHSAESDRWRSSKTFRQAGSRAGLLGPFLFWLQENAISLDQAASPSGSLFSMETRPTVAL